MTLKLREGLPSLRSKEAFRCLRRALAQARACGLRVVHFAILSNHVHLIVEPSAIGGTAARGAGQRRQENLGRALQSLCISFSKSLNGALKRRGGVFRERYHMHILKTPAEARRALAYVLTNESRHRRNPGNPGNPTPRVRIDPYSSAFAFPPEGWKALLNKRPRLEMTAWSEDWIHAWLDEALRAPRTWLLTQGWKRRPSPARQSHQCD